MVRLQEACRRVARGNTDARCMVGCGTGAYACMLSCCSPKRPPKPVLPGMPRKAAPVPHPKQHPAAAEGTLPTVHAPLPRLMAWWYCWRIHALLGAPDPLCGLRQCRETKASRHTALEASTAPQRTHAPSLAQHALQLRAAVWHSDSEQPKKQQGGLWSGVEAAACNDMRASVRQFKRSPFA